MAASDEGDQVMEQLKEQLEKVDAELREAQAKEAFWMAERAGLEAKREALTERMHEHRAARAAYRSTTETSSGSEEILRARTRGEAIVAALLQAHGDMHIDEVVDALKASGRQAADNYQVVASTLNQLVNDGRVARPRRGVYRSIDR